MAFYPQPQMSVTAERVKVLREALHGMGGWAGANILVSGRGEVMREGWGWYSWKRRKVGMGWTGADTLKLVSFAVSFSF